MYIRVEVSGVRQFVKIDDADIDVITFREFVKKGL